MFTHMRLRLPIRLKLAAVSAVLTFAILLLFAVVVGGFTERRLRTSADAELRATTGDLQNKLQGFKVSYDYQTNQPIIDIDRTQFNAASAGGAAIRVVSSTGTTLLSTPNSGDLGPPVDGEPRNVGKYRVLARPLFGPIQAPTTDGFGATSTPYYGAVAYLQYAKPRENLEATIGRVRFFLILGVVVGTAFAFAAGFAVARRAMRPISGLTKAAREVARTRDPARTPLPRPAANDEIAELATTLGDMLQELDAARNETEAALERQREFVADASHELRTPLTSILANLELLEERLVRSGGPSDTEAAEITASALRSSKRMRRLVGDLLLLARADAGRRAPQQPVDLIAVAQDVVSEASAFAAGHSLTLDLPPAGGPVLVEGSHDDLHRMSLNLIENALLHTPPGTPVVASVRSRDGRVVLQVADRGPGVPIEQRERIFERFARRDGDSSTVGGSGLGLAIVRAVAEAHGGTVTVRDADGGGALFEVTLPAAAIRSSSTRVSRSEPDPNGWPPVAVEHEPISNPKGAQHT